MSDQSYTHHTRDLYSEASGKFIIMVLPFYSRFCNKCWGPHFGELYEDLVLAQEFMTSLYFY